MYDPLTAEMSTDGNDSPLTIVRPEADKDWDMFSGDDSLVELAVELSGDDGIIGILKQLSNSSWERNGCHKGSAGSDTIENMLFKSSRDKTPSWSESN